MYYHNMHRIYRSPEGGEGGGSAPETPPTDTPEVPETPKAPEYTSKADFDAFRSEFQQTISRFAPKEPERKTEAGEPAKPDVSKYDFKQPGELDRYNLDNYKYHRHLDRADEAKENESRAAQDRLIKNENEHGARVEAYRKENPDFTEALKAAGNIMVDDKVKSAVYASKNSHLALHFIVKNPDAVRELNMIARSGDASDVRERVGEMASEMKAQSKQSEENTRAASVQPPRQSFRGGASNSKRTLSDSERFERFSQG